MKKLISGVREFHRQLALGRRSDYEGLGEGQSPSTLFFTCADSRVVPAFIANAEPGELFTVRNVGNIVPPARDGARPIYDGSEASALEYALETLAVSDVVVCGHSGCGAMAALQVPASEVSPNLREWLTHARPCLDDRGFPEGVGAENQLTDRLSKRNVIQQLAALRTYDSVAEKERAGRLQLHGWWFDIRGPRVEVFDQREGRFVAFETYWR